MYRINDLLDLALRERAEELSFQTQRSPLMIAKGTELELGLAPPTEDELSILLATMATPAQMQEFAVCGDIHFVYDYQNFARFAVTARKNRDTFSLHLKNLTR